MDETIELLIRRIQVLPPTDCQSNLTCKPPPPVHADQFADFECESGIVLPVFLRRIYTEVANGGFGPAWGINPLMGDETFSIAHWDRIVQNAKHDDTEPYPWPEHLIRFCEIGCNMYFGVDIREESGPVFKVDPTCGSTQAADWLTLVNESAEAWLRGGLTRSLRPGNQGADNKRMNRSDLALASFVTNYVFIPTCRPVILVVMWQRQ